MQRNKLARLLIICSVIIIAGIMLLPQTVNAGEQQEYVRRYPFGIKFEDGRPEQYIYLIPANIGGTIFTAIGGFVCWPVSASWNAYHGHTTRRDLVPPVRWASNTIGLAGAYLLGSPFWGLEQLFWEFPKWLFGYQQPVEENRDDSDLIGGSI